MPVILKADLFPLAEPANAVVQEIVSKPEALFSFWDSNMAMQRWRWNFELNDTPDGTFTLSATQLLEDPEEDDEPWDVDPALSLRSGADIYWAMLGMLETAGYPVEHADFDEIGNTLRHIDTARADEFLSEHQEQSCDG